MPPRKRSTTRKTTRKPTRKCKKCTKYTGTSLDAMIAEAEGTPLPKKKKESKLKKFAKYAGALALAGVGGYAGYKAMQKLGDRLAVKQLNNKNINKQDKINIGRIMNEKLKSAKKKWEKEKEEINKKKWFFQSKIKDDKTDQQLLGLQDDEMANYNESMKLYQQSMMDGEIRQIMNEAISCLPTRPDKINPQVLIATIKNMATLLSEYGQILYINDFQPRQARVEKFLDEWPTDLAGTNPEAWNSLQQSLQAMMKTYDEIMDDAF